MPTTSRISRASFSDLVYDRLVQSLLSGQFDFGEELNEVGLASEFGVSRTPVREALRRLAAEGLVNIAPNRQATVVQLSSAEVIETYEVRRILESAAARMAAENLSSGDLSTLRQLATTAATIDGLKHCDPERRFDDELHRTVAAGCGNTRLAAEISRYLNLVRLVRTRNQYDASALAKAHLEHEEILTALEAREPRAAEAAMSAHIASGLQYVLSHYFCK